MIAHRFLFYSSLIIIMVFSILWIAGPRKAASQTFPQPTIMDNALASDPTLGEKRNLKTEVNLQWTAQGEDYSGSLNISAQSLDGVVYRFNWKRARAAGFSVPDQPGATSDWLITPAGSNTQVLEEIRAFSGDLTIECEQPAVGGPPTTERIKANKINPIGDIPKEINIDGAETISDDRVVISIVPAQYNLVFKSTICHDNFEIFRTAAIPVPLSQLGQFQQDNFLFNLSFKELSDGPVTKTISVPGVVQGTVRVTMGPPDPCDPMSGLQENVDFGISDIPRNPRTERRPRAETDNRTGVVVFDRGYWDRSSARQKASTWQHELTHQIDQKVGNFAIDPTFIVEWRGWKAAADYIKQCVNLNDPAITLAEATDLAIKKSIIYTKGDTLRPLHEVFLLLRNRGYNL